MILSTWKNIGIIFTKFVISIYEGFAYCYNLMCNLITNLDSTFNLNFGTIKESVYVLIAVFMLFRITISLLEYLIDPDKISDKSVGAGKLITRIIISLVLLLSANFLFDFSKRVEKSLLEGDSILFNIFEKEDSGTDGSQVQTKYCNLNGKNITTIDELEDEVLYCIFTSSLESEMKSIIKNISDDSRPIEFLTKDVQSHGVPDIDFFRNNEEYVITAIDDPLIDPFSLKQRIYIYFNKSEGTKNETLEGTDGNVVSEKVLAAFSNKPEDIIGSNLLIDVDAENKIAKAVEHEEMKIINFLALIFGICLVVFIIIICIEVVIRQLKLTVLEMLAPIAFVSYMNPNDKILGNWFQKYIGCYLDLFIKLLAINIGTYLITSIDFSFNDTYGGFAFILLYIGVFLFIKTVPNLISDVLGIKNMGGTFKDSMNALKTAAFTGAGAVAGAGVGLVSGMGKGASFSTVAGGLLGGAFRGAAGGAKGGLGGITKSTSTQRQNNISARESNLNGGNWYQRMLGKVGMDSATRADKDITKLDVQKKKYDEMAGYQKSAEEIAESSNYMKDLRAENDVNLANGKPSYSSKELEDMRDKWAGVQAATKLSLDKNDGMYKVDKNGSIWQRQSNGTLTNTGYTYEAGKAAGIASCVVQAESTRHGDRFFNSDKTENSPFATAISSYDDMKTAAKESKKRASQITEQEVAVKHSDSYIAGVASRNNKK